MNNTPINENDFIKEEHHMNKKHYCARKITKHILNKYDINENEYMKIVKQIAHQRMRDSKVHRNV